VAPLPRYRSLLDRWPSTPHEWQLWHGSTAGKTEHTPKEQRHVAAIGIDIGAEGFHLCVPSAPSADVKDWPVWHVSYEKQPDWRDVLRRLITEETVVLAEPTGWNYLSPVARVICLQSPARLYLIEHSRTTHVRRTLDIAQKTDVQDTRTLAYAAQQLHTQPSFAGCWRFDWATNDALLELRFMMNAYHKASTDRTRFKNRLNHLGHSIDPALNFGKAWLTAMRLGAFTSDEITALDVSKLPASSRRAVERLLMVDTLAMGMIGADENSARDMGPALASCRGLIDLLGATVLLGAPQRQGGAVRARQQRAAGEHGRNAAGGGGR
jgi:hypothetical protein